MIHPLPRPKKRAKKMRSALRQAKSELAIPTSPPPLRDPEYRKWLRHQQCAVYQIAPHATGIRCWSPDQGYIANRSRRESFGYLSDAAHCDKGQGEKISDEYLIPLCRQHHCLGSDSQESNHERFDIVHGIDRYKLAKAYHEQYEAERAA